MRSDLRQDERGDDGGDDSELHLREAEHRIGGGDCNVAAGGETGSAAECVAVDPRDDGRRTVVDRLAHAIQAQGVLDVLVEGEVDRRALPFDVRPRAEARAVAGEHDRARVAHVPERVCEVGDQLCVEGIAPVGPRERHAQDVAVTLDPEPAH